MVSENRDHRCLFVALIAVYFTQDGESLLKKLERKIRIKARSLKIVFS